MNILTTSQITQLTALVQDISQENGIPASINMSYDYVSVHFSPKDLDGPQITSDELPRHQILNEMARELAELSPSDMENVIVMARNRVKDDPVKRLALEVSKLNGYALGAFMQFLMKFGNQKDSES